MYTLRYYRYTLGIGGRPLYCEATKSSDIIMAGSNLAKASHFILAASPIMNNKILADPEAYNKREFRSMIWHYELAASSI